MIKRLTSMLLTLAIFMSAAFNITFADNLEKNKRRVYLHADTHNPSETKTVSEVEKGELFNLYLAIDNPNKGAYNSEPLDNLPELKNKIAIAEDTAKKDTLKDAEAYADLKGLTDPEKRAQAISEYMEKHLDINIAIARERTEQIARHTEAHYDLNGYSLKIYYDGNFFEFVKNPDSTANGVIDYTIPGNIPSAEIGPESAGNTIIDEVPKTAGYYLRESGAGLDPATGLNYAYVHVYFSGSFLPQEQEPYENWYDLCAIPLRAKETGSSTVYLATGSDYGIKLYAKHTSSNDFSPLFSTTAENGGYHTINIVNQKKPNPPVASPDTAINYTTPQEITLSCSTPDCDIYYSKNGGEFIKYQTPFTINSTSEIVAYSQKKSDATAVSNYATFKYRIVPEKPLLYEENNGQMVLIPDVYNKDEQFIVFADNRIPYDSTTFPSNTTIYYTYSDIYPEDFTSGGNNPYTEWVALKKGSGNPISVEGASTIRLIARIEDENEPETSEVSLYRLGVKPQPVTAEPLPGTLSSPETVILKTETSDASIYYTLDGSDPRADGIKYNNSGISVNSTALIRAAALKDGIWSDVSDFDYSYINPDDSFISAIAPPGEYTGSVNVSLIASKEGENITYSTDGGNSWKVYDKTIVVSDDTEIIAKTSKGTEYTFSYKVVPQPPVFSPESTLFPTTEKVTVYAPETTNKNTTDYTLYYSFGDSDPKTEGIKADELTDTKVFDITSKTTINAVVKKGEKWSEVVSNTYDVYTKRPAPPVATLPSGEYTKKINGDDILTGFLNPSEDTDIYYTVSSMNSPNPDPVPGANGTLYTPGDKFELTGAVTVNAIAVNRNTKKQSEISVFYYIIVPEAPKSAIPSGEILSAVIPVDSVEGATLIYKAGGFSNEIPNAPQRVYINLKTGNAYDNPECSGMPLGTDNQTPNTEDIIPLEITSELSGIKSGTNKYEFTVKSGILTPPTADKPSGTYPEANSDGENNFLTVTLTSDNNGLGTVYYKENDGSWVAYTEPLKLKKDTVLYTKTVNGSIESDINVYVYEFTPPAPVFSKESGEYSKGTVISVKLPDNLPDDKLYTIMLRSSKDPEGTEDIPIANNTEFVIDSSVSYKAYIISEDGKRSENTIRNYRVSDSYVISGSIYPQEPYTVSNGNTRYISRHLLSQKPYNEGIRLNTTTHGAQINYSYTVIRKNTPPATSDIRVYDDTLPIPVNSSMDSIIINARLTDSDNGEIPGSDCTFIYKFIDIKVPETDLYRADPTKIEYPEKQTFIFEDDYNSDPLYRIYYTTDATLKEIGISNSQLYNFGDPINVASNLTVRACYYKACGECDFCDIAEYESCTNSAWGDVGTYKYTVPTKVIAGGGGYAPLKQEYTKDIFGNEHPTHIGYIKGYPDGSVRPDTGMSREEIAAVIYRISNHLYEEPFETTGTVFPDVAKNRWSATEIEYLANKNVLCGYPDGDYKPSKKLTRAEFAALISRFTNRKSTNLKLPFADIKESHWAYGYIASLYESKLISGYEDNTFKPDNTISRAEVMTVVNKLLGRNPSPSYLKALGYNPYNDLEKTDWHYSIVLEATITHNYILKNGLEIKWEDIK